MQVTCVAIFIFRIFLIEKSSSHWLSVHIAHTHFVRSKHIHETFVAMTHSVCAPHYYLCIGTSVQCPLFHRLKTEIRRYMHAIGVCVWESWWQAAVTRVLHCNPFRMSTFSFQFFFLSHFVLKRMCPFLFDMYMRMRCSNFFISLHNAQSHTHIPLLSLCRHTQTRVLCVRCRNV